MSDEIRNGGCLCGAVRFRLSGRPLRVGICHCQDCRKASGSAYSMFGVWDRAAYAGEGELRTFNGRSFCPTCGSRVAHLDEAEAEAEVMLGSLDDAPSDLIPSYEVWTPRRERWMHVLPWADQFQGDRTENGGGWRQPYVQR